MSAEKRQWVRHPTLSLATLRLQTLERVSGSGTSCLLSGCVLDISLGGVGLSCSFQPEVGTSLWMRIDLEGESLEALALVVHSDATSGAVGLLFTRLCHVSFATLHRFVRYQSAGRPRRPLPPALELAV